MTTAPSSSIAGGPEGPGATDLGRGLIGAGIAVSAWSTGTILAKYIDMDGLAIGAYRFGIFAVFIVLWMRARGTPFTLRVMRASAWGGLALGLDIALFFTAVKETSIVNATMIGALQPIVVGLVAARFFGERIRLKDAAWSLIALVGVFVIVAAPAAQEVTSLRGDLLATAAMFSWSAYFIASKQSKEALTPTEFTAGTSWWAAIICTPIGFGFGQDMSFPSITNLALILLMAVSSGVIGHALMNWSLVRIPLWVGSTFTLLIPVFAALMAWVFLGESLNPTQGLAMAVVIGSLAAIVHNQAQTADP